MIEEVRNEILPPPNPDAETKIAALLVELLQFSDSLENMSRKIRLTAVSLDCQIDSLRLRDRLHPEKEKPASKHAATATPKPAAASAADPLDLGSDDVHRIPVDPDPDLLLAELQELFDMISDAIESNERSEDFCESVKAQAIDMEEWVRKNDHATAKQLETVTNWKSGVAAWIKHD